MSVVSIMSVGGIMSVAGIGMVLSWVWWEGLSISLNQ